MATHSLADIEDFLRQKRIALVGASRDSRHFSRVMLRELAGRGYEVLPVNPKASTIEGLPSSASVAASQPSVDAALIMTPPGESAAAVRDCVAGGVSRIWLYAAVTQGSVTAEAIEAGRDAGATVIAGECPFMFLPNAGFIHGVHRLIRRIGGALPR